MLYCKREQAQAYAVPSLRYRKTGMLQSILPVTSAMSICRPVKDVIPTAAKPGRQRLRVTLSQRGIRMQAELKADQYQNDARRKLPKGNSRYLRGSTSYDQGHIAAFACISRFSGSWCCGRPCFAARSLLIVTYVKGISIHDVTVKSPDLLLM